MLLVEQLRYNDKLVHACVYSQGHPRCLRVYLPVASACEKTVSMDRSMSPGVGSKVFAGKKRAAKGRERTRVETMAETRVR